jgi:protein-tyrosine phosphatase
VNDDGHVKPIDWFKRAIDFALPALALPNTKIYAHCAAGINRGPSLAYAILRAQGLEANLAYSLIKTARPISFIGYAKDADIAIKSLGYE